MHLAYAPSNRLIGVTLVGMAGNQCSAGSACVQRHNGVNLVVGDLRMGRTAYVTNRGPEGPVRGPREVSRGLHALSNATLDEAWPKARARCSMGA